MAAARCQFRGRRRRGAPACACLRLGLHRCRRGRGRPGRLHADRPLKIAVLGLETTLLDSGQEGALKAAEELEAVQRHGRLDCAGRDAHRRRLQRRHGSGHCREYDAIATIAGDAGPRDLHRPPSTPLIPVATFNSETAAQQSPLLCRRRPLQSRAKRPARPWLMPSAAQARLASSPASLRWKRTNCGARLRGLPDRQQSRHRDCGAGGEQRPGRHCPPRPRDMMTANPDLAGIYVTAGGPFGGCRRGRRRQDGRGQR